MDLEFCEADWPNLGKKGPSNLLETLIINCPIKSDLIQLSSLKNPIKLGFFRLVRLSIGGALFILQQAKPLPVPDKH